MSEEKRDPFAIGTRRRTLVDNILKIKGERGSPIPQKLLDNFYFNPKTSMNALSSTLRQLGLKHNREQGEAARQRGASLMQSLAPPAAAPAAPTSNLPRTESIETQATRRYTGGGGDILRDADQLRRAGRTQEADAREQDYERFARLAGLPRNRRETTSPITAGPTREMYLTDGMFQQAVARDVQRSLPYMQGPQTIQGSGLFNNIMSELNTQWPTSFGRPQAQQPPGLMDFIQQLLGRT